MVKVHELQYNHRGHEVLELTCPVHHRQGLPEGWYSDMGFVDHPRWCEHVAAAIRQILRERAEHLRATSGDRNSPSHVTVK